MPKTLPKEPEVVATETAPPEPEKFPIESAPKLGQVVLLYSETITHGVQGLWRRTRHCVGGRWRTNDGWVDPLTKKHLGAQWTHWRPL